LQRLYPKKAPQPSGQISLFLARLHAFGGGLMPRVVANETEFRRRQRQLSQPELAAHIGMSQGHYANIIRGHDPISRWAVNRLQDVLLRW
jgi:hypothetical protein